MKSATRVFASTLGAVMALAGIEHGIGEILQGNVAPGGVMILSWPEAEFFRGLGGEPALTVIPNLLVTGILAVVVSLALLVWAVFFVHRRHGGVVMMILSAAMLPVGGGVFPPILAVMIGAVATQIGAPLTWWRTHLPAGLRRFLVRVWPWSLGTCVVAWVGAFPAGYWFGETAPLAMVAVLLVALGTLILTAVASLAYDSR